MKVQIVVDKGLVIIDYDSINIDCSKFKEQFVFCEVNEKARWVEKEPFEGREKLKDWSKVDSFIDEAKTILNKKANKPNDYSIWDEISKNWIEDMELKKEYEESLIPKTLTPRQARLILLQYELLDDIEEVAKANKVISIWWEYSLDIQRYDERLLKFSSIAGITDEMLDTLFNEGSKL